MGFWLSSPFFQKILWLLCLIRGEVGQKLALTGKILTNAWTRREVFCIFFKDWSKHFQPPKFQRLLRYSDYLTLQLLKNLHANSHFLSFAERNVHKMFRFCGKIGVCELYRKKETESFKVNLCEECDEEFCNKAPTNNLSLAFIVIMSASSLFLSNLI